MMGMMMVGLFFLKFWRKTKDRFFLNFSIAFFMLSFERWLLLKWGGNVDETETWVYFVRLAAFIMIAVSIIDKNRGKNLNDR